MKVVAAVDKFRGTASGADVASAIGHACWERGHDCLEVPMPDGGEGLLEVLERGFEDRGGSEAVTANRGLRRRARELMHSKLRSRFDLDEEKEAVRDRYGRHNLLEPGRRPGRA